MKIKFWFAPLLPIFLLHYSVGSTIKQFSQEIPCSIYKIVPHSGHHIMIDQAETVNEAIKLVVLTAREKESSFKLHRAWQSMQIVIY